MVRKKTLWTEKRFGGVNWLEYEICGWKSEEDLNYGKPEESFSKSSSHLQRELKGVVMGLRNQLGSCCVQECSNCL